MIAAHEILGHAVEDISGGDTDESHVRQIENVFRKEQRLPARDILHDNQKSSSSVNLIALAFTIISSLSLQTTAHDMCTSVAAPVINISNVKLKHKKIGVAINTPVVQP